jgi:hypothetical protein
MMELDWQTKDIVVEPSVEDLIVARRLAEELYQAVSDSEMRIKARKIRKLIDCSLDKISTLSRLSHVQWESAKFSAIENSTGTTRVWHLSMGASQA